MSSSNSGVGYSQWAQNWSPPWEVPIWGGIPGKLLPEVHPWDVSSGYSLPRIGHSRWFWQQNLHTGPSLCIIDTLGVETN